MYFFLERAEPEFVNIYEAQESIPSLAGLYDNPYMTYRPFKLHRLAESIPGLLKRLQIRALILIEGQEMKEVLQGK